jgi:hypothetical protein
MVTLDRERGIRITTAIGPMRWAEFRLQDEETS